MAERIAGRSRTAVWQRVMHRLPQLGPTEARGYVRARAAAVVHEEASRLIEQEGAKIAALRAPIEDAARALLVQMIAAQIDHRRLQAKTRRAA